MDLCDVVDYQSFKGCSYCIIWQHTIKITTVQTFWYYHKMYRHSVPVKRWWPLNWQIMSQPECHNFKILLQTTNNFTSDEIFRQNRIKICENTSVFILFGNVFFDANNRSRGARAAARETNSSPSSSGFGITCHFYNSTISIYLKASDFRTLI